MKLFLPTRIYNEKHCIENHSRELAALGRKAFIVTGRTSSRVNGALEDMITALCREKIEYAVFDEIEENPSVETVLRARESGLLEKADFIIGIGGGSPMDAAKAIALLMANPARGESFLYTKPAEEFQEAFPVVEVPTTAGTGSEVTPYAILTRKLMPDIVLTMKPDTEAFLPIIEAKQTKQSISHQIFPALALIDIDYLQTVSQESCIYTAVDALAHLIESQLNTNATAYSRIYSETGLRVWGQLKDKLRRYEIGEEERALLMHACTLGGMAITHTGTSLPHGLSYPITCELGMPHGKAVGIFLPGLIRNYGNREEAARVLGLLDFTGELAFSEYLRELLGEVTLSPELWERTMEEVLQNPAKLKNYPFLVNKEKLQQFL